MERQEIVSLFLQFREECIWLRVCYNTHEALFSNEQAEEILRRSAPLFFQDINRVLHEYIILRVCVITDPARTGTKLENLTVEAINIELGNLGLLTGKIQSLAEALQGYRTKVESARNKLISHLDRGAALGQAELGAHLPEEVHAFYENLQEYCDEVGRALGVGPLDFRVSSGPGDALDLLRFLKSSVGR